MKNLINYGLIAALLATVGLSWFFYFREVQPGQEVDISKFPNKIGTWTGEEVPIAKEDLAILETTNAFVRRYTNLVDNSAVYLYIVYSEGNRRVSHPPEICYTGSGINITEKAHDPITVSYKNLTIDTNRLHLTKGDFEHLSFYWFKVGENFTASYWKQQGLIALNALRGKKTSSALIRVSADVTKGNDKASIEHIKAFTSLIVPELLAYLP